MRTPTSLRHQLSTMRDDTLRILVVGAGIAGVTLAQALRAAGRHPVLIERAAPDADRGYMLGMMPLIDPAIRAVGVEAEYQANSQYLNRYRVRGRHGVLLREYAMGELLSAYGEYRGISRGALLDVLSTHGAPVTFDATVSAITQTPEAALATIAAGGDSPLEAEFDLIVIADGLHSTTRGLVLRPDQVTTFDSGWGGWVGWSNLDPATADLMEETWGAGFFVGTYPVKGRIGVFAGGDRADTGVGPTRFVERIRADLGRVDERTDRALTAIATGDDLYFWKLTDARSADWSVGRVGLLGDAAAGFLPTAGIGAAMAMESAAHLARLITEVDRAGVPLVLERYEREQRPRVLAAQDNSRQLARLLFRRGAVAAAVRDAATRFLPLSLALGPIRKLHTDRPAV